MSLLCYEHHHICTCDKTEVCSPVRTLGVLPTYKHTKRTHKEAGYQLYPTPRLLSVRTHFPITTLAIGARTQKNCTERLSPQVDLHGLSAGLAAHSRKEPTPKKKPSAMGMSDAKCAARNPLVLTRCIYRLSVNSNISCCHNKMFKKRRGWRKP